MQNCNFLNIFKRLNFKVFICLFWCLCTCVYMSVTAQGQTVGVSSLYPRTPLKYSARHASLAISLAPRFPSVFRADEINEAKMNFHLLGFRKQSQRGTGY